MTIPTDIGGLAAWFDTSLDIQKLSEDFNNPCALSGDYVRWVSDGLTPYPKVFVAPNSGRPPASSYSTNTGISDGVRFRVDAFEQTSGGPNLIPGAAIDSLFRATVNSIVAGSTCGDLVFVTADNLSIPSCWTMFSVFSLDSYITPYPTYSILHPSFPPSLLGGFGAGLIGGGTGTGLLILYNDVYQTPTLAAQNAGSVRVVDTTPIPLGTKLIVEASKTSTTLCLWKNGTFINSVAASGTGGTGAIGLGGGIVAHKSSDFTPHYQMDHFTYESLLYTSLLNTAERDAIRQNLASKWGVSGVDLSSSSECESCGAPGTAGARTSVTLIGAT